jgi:hypothetical protein
MSELFDEYTHIVADLKDWGTATVNRGHVATVIAW